MCNGTLKFAIVFSLLLLTATACAEATTLASEGETTATTASEGQVTTTVANEADVAALRSLMEANVWRIVERSGFPPSPIDGEVTFQVSDSIPIIRLVSVPCGRAGAGPIEWGGAGFTLVSNDGPTFFATEDVGCDPPDDLQNLLWLGDGSNDFGLEVLDGGSTVILSKNDQTLTLTPTQVEQTN